METYLRNTKLTFGKYKWKKLSEVWKINPTYITEYMLGKAVGICISENTLNELRDPKTINTTKYCYKGYMDDFLSIDLQPWLSIMNKNYENNRGDFAEQGLIGSWIDCFKQLKRHFAKYRGRHYYLIFEYELELGSGRRTDVILLMENDVVILEFKEKEEVKRKDILQLQDYAYNISGYHIGSRGKRITPVLVETRKSAYLEDSKIKICSPDSLSRIINRLNGEEISYDPALWIESAYEPLPTIVESARMIMEHRELPQIKQARSAGIPDALALLKQVALQAEREKEHILALVTGVPGAGKTLLGLQFTYDNYGADDGVNSVYLSGNSPLVRVLQSALESDVFVKNLHAEIYKFYIRNNTEFSKNIIVFDEGQRAWDKEKVGSKYPTLKGQSEPELVINMVDKRSDWSVLLILVGEGQEIHKGEEKGLGQWNEAIIKSKNNWKVLCPDKIETYFQGQQFIKDINRNKLDLKVSLRSRLAGQVSNWVNELLSSNIAKAKIMSEEIKSKNFQLFITRELNVAKSFCYDKYEGLQDKRYGLIASSKDFTVRKFGVNNSYKATKEVNFGDWYNNPLGEEGSCCNFNSTVTEFGCQGLELDFPVLAWGDDMVWEGRSWRKFTRHQEDVEDPNQLRLNSYRVLMTRGRDGLIIFVPNVRRLDSVYNVLQKAGLDEIH
ncbi:DUF2075 domain-containing protein [Bacillus paranthracis]|uniref:DUF2075 domain-containing protein n=1 Tax=Bacillus paranthracis TaxID=2026186 RepID=UPI0021D1F97C|nr:DUF2075 domain-containing protein [Bacillus paranthracis]MCU5469861.1 DUF2075 domain-containing protein [Bacillus paranthracis]